MFYKKTGIPEEGEIVLCTVKKILYNSVFVELDEYKNIEGMIHISEIAPGRIRNLRDFVKEDKKIICKVLRVNKEKGQIDLSLRRVNQATRLKKSEEYKQEEKSEKILEILAQRLKTDLKTLYSKSGEKIIEEYGLLNFCFQKVVKEGEKVLTDLKIDKKISKELTKIIQERIKPQKVKINSIIILKNSAPDGINIIKRILQKAEDLVKDQEVTIKYLGAPRYSLTVISEDYKSAEKITQKISEQIIDDIKKEKGEGEFIRNV